MRHPLLVSRCMRFDNSQIKKDIMVATTNAVAKFAAIVAGLGLVAMSFASFAPSAKAMTVDEIAAQIAALQAQLAALTGGSSSGSSTTFTMDLTLGSTGSEVTALQNFLIGKGHSIPAGATGYFGAQTQAALAAFQAANGVSPAAGYFGPITRAKVNGMGGGSTSDDSDDSDDDSDLSGGAGSVDTYTIMSTLTNEEVGEDEEDVEVAGLEIEADSGSDLELTAVRLVFDEGTAASDFEDYATEVSLWLDGEEVGRVDADEFTDDNSWTTTISLDGAVIEAGETAELVLAISGIGNLDSADATDTWTIDFRQVRFEDADGASISEDPSTGTRTFSFEAFATAADVELKIASDDDDVNDAHVIDVHATNKTQDVELASFTLEAEGDSDIEIKKFGINLDVTGAAHVDDVLSGGTSPALWLEIEGDTYGTADYFDDADDTDVGTDEDVLFDDVDYTINAGDTVTVLIKADLLALSGDIDEADTIQVSLTETETDQATLVKVKDEAGEDLADADKTGSVTTGAHAVHDVGVQVTFVSASEAVLANDNAVDNDIGTFTMVFDITAFGGTVYVGDTAIGTTVADSAIGSGALTDAIVYRVYDSGTATVDDLADTITFTTPAGVVDSTDNIEIQDGKTSRVTLTTTQTNDSAEDDGIYYMDMAAIYWGIADDTTYEFVYKYDLDDFETSTVSLN